MKKTDKVTPFGMEDTNSSQSKLTLESIFHEFAAETTAHGIPRIISRRKPLSKVFWLCLVVGALTIFFVQTATLLSNYYAFNTKIKLINSEEVYFPAVTVCNLNRMKRSLLESSPEWARFVSEDESFTKNTDDQDMSQTFNPNLSQQGEVTMTPENDSTVIIRRKRDEEEEFDNYENWYYDSSLNRIDDGPEDMRFSPDIGALGETPPASSASQTPTREDLKTFGHQSKDFILQCTFNKIPCNHTYFYTLQNMEYGNCFTFNGNSSKSPRVTKIGSNFGLHLTLNIEENEYVGSFTEETGIRIMVHPADILPHPEDVGLSVTPGLSTNIGIRQVEIRRLSAPHGNCTDGKGHEYLQNHTYSYSIISCQKKCLFDEMVSHCSCVTDIYDDYSDVPFCAGKTQRRCRQSVEKRFYTNDLDCDCPAQCHEYIYNMQATSSIWPSEQYHKILVKNLQRQEKYSPEILEDVTKTRKNLVRVKIYFQELNYELVEQVPANTVESVLGTTGGLLGLYIGFSVITISEIFVLIYDVFAFFLKRK